MCVFTCTHMDIIEVKQKKATWLWLPEGKREVCVSVCVGGFELNNYILPSVLKRPWTITYFSLSLFSRGLWSLSWPLNTHRCFFSFSVSSFQSAGLVTVAVLPQHNAVLVVVDVFDWRARTSWSEPSRADFTDVRKWKETADFKCLCLFFSVCE